MLGPVGGQKVVELGAGIGRFTGALAATAKSVLAVDFMDNLIAENQKTHGHRFASLTGCRDSLGRMCSNCQPTTQQLMLRVVCQEKLVPAFAASSTPNDSALYERKSYGLAGKISSTWWGTPLS